MLHRAIAIAALSALLLPGATFASEKNKSAMKQSDSTTMDRSTKSIPEEFEAKLRQEGFSDVEVVPGSFFVSAKDKNGDVIHAVITPTSLTVLTLDTSSNKSAAKASSNTPSKTENMTKPDTTKN